MGKGSYKEQTTLVEIKSLNLKKVNFQDPSIFHAFFASLISCLLITLHWLFEIVCFYKKAELYSTPTVVQSLHKNKKKLCFWSGQIIPLHSFFHFGVQSY
jgi:hypothetical protein